MLAVSTPTSPLFLTTGTKHLKRCKMEFKKTIIHKFCELNLNIQENNQKFKIVVKKLKISLKIHVFFDF